MMHHLLYAPGIEMKATRILRTLMLAAAVWLTPAQSLRADDGNPVIKDNFTADPAPMVYKDTVYLYTGHDEATGKEMFRMWDWLCYSSKDMKTWTAHGPIMRVTDFKWAVADAWASQCIERNGKFYFYAAVRHDKTHGGMAIGVAVSDSPTGPFVDARGSALITDDMTPGPNPWDDIDPTVFIDDDGTAWLSWGNPNCYLVKLKPNMTELDGPIQKIHLPNYTEAPWLYKRQNLYYLIYAAFAHQGMGEKICYATAPKVDGPWTYRGILSGPAAKSYTIHPGVIDFHGQSYFFYHNATLTLNGQTGALGRRCVCVDYMYYNPDGTIRPITQTTDGVLVPPTSTFPASETAKEENAKEGSYVPSPGVGVTQNAGFDPESWPGNPVVKTTDDPYHTATSEISFNYKGGVQTMGQTFTVDSGIRLRRIALFGGDGFGTGPENPVTLALYDLGTQNVEEAGSYTTETNLLGSGQGLKIAYEPQASGLLFFDFSGSNQVSLIPGHRYVFELQGIKKSAPLFWRRTQKDTYAAGAAFINRSLLVNKENKPCDFTMALYGELLTNGAAVQKQ